MTRKRWPVAVTTAVVLSATIVAASTLKAESLAGWSAYIAATESRLKRELADKARFLATDFTSDAAADLKSARAGAVVIRSVETKTDQGKNVDVPSAMVHHWRGLVFIPNVSFADVYAWVKSGAADTGQEDVLKTSVLERADDHVKLYLKLRRKKVVTAVYNTEHYVTFAQLSNARATSTSTATKIAELEDPDTPKERELPPGQDRGFLWRWNVYWRYQAVDGGVMAECESISLSRDIPPIIGFMISPIVKGTARESMERTLVAVRARLQR